MVNAVKVKICGITWLSDALAAVEAGAWALGFIFHKKSPRYVSPSKARTIIESLPPFVTPVGVFVDHSENAVRDICHLTGIATVQFHGEESPAYCKRFKHFRTIKAFRVKDGLDSSSTRKPRPCQTGSDGKQQQIKATTQSFFEN